MPTYSKSDFNDANNALSIFQQDILDATMLIKSINNFRDNSKSKLLGASWDLVRESLNDYIQVLNIRINNCQSLSDCIKKSNDLMIAAIGNNESINTDKLDELNETYNRCINLSKSFNNSKITDKEKAQYENLMYETKRLIDQIERVKNAEQSAINQLNSVLESNNNYNNQVDNITPSPIIYSNQI